jgi:DNA-binding SARP family transcriptional activator
VLTFRVLGQLEVVDEHGPIQLGGRRQRAILATLLLSKNMIVSIDRMVDELYAEAPPVTAVIQVQKQISELRQLLGPTSGIYTRSPGYSIRLLSGQLDLDEFEHLSGEADRARACGEREQEANLLRSALELWRGEPLADLGSEAFAQRAIGRLREVRLAALERRIDADLALGRSTELIGELEVLVNEVPLRERFREQLMLALYRCGRQAEALDVFRTGHEILVERFGVEPGPGLRELQRAILNQSKSLNLAVPRSAKKRAATLLVLPSDMTQLDSLLAIAAPLTNAPGSESIVVRVLADGQALASEATALSARCLDRRANARTAAFTSSAFIEDTVELATTHAVDLVLIDAQIEPGSGLLSSQLAGLLERSPADVGTLVGSRVQLGHSAGIYVPFGGGDHEWAALEIAAWLAGAAGIPLRLLGAKADATHHRDASHLLANASLAVQRVVGVLAEPILVDSTPTSIVAIVEHAGLVVAGLPSRWRTDGIGSFRLALVHDSAPATLLVHRGMRPSGIAPADAETRFSWSIEAPADQ